MRLQTLLFCLFILRFAQGQSNLKIGDHAPDIIFQKSFLNGYSIPTHKAIFLDFWGTYCAPCIAGLSQTNHLVGRYSNRLEFIAITDTKSWKVAEFIKAKHLKYKVIIDKNQMTFQNYKVVDIPMSFIIDSSGIIRWMGIHANSQIIEEFINTNCVTENKPEAFNKSRFENDSIKRDSYKLVIINRTLLEKNLSVLKVLIDNENQTLEGYSNQPEVDGVLTAINFSLSKLASETQVYFKNKCLITDIKSIKKYDFINIPFATFEEMNSVLVLKYGIKFEKYVPKSPITTMNRLVF